MAIVLEGRVRQAGKTRQARCVGICQAVDGDQVQIGNRSLLPRLRVPVDTPFSRAAQVFKHTDAAGAKTALGQQRGNQGGAAAVIAQYQQAHATGQVCVDRRQWPRHHGHCHHLLQRPAQACRRQGYRRGRGQNRQLLSRHVPGQAGADAIEHRVATGQDAHRLPTPRQHRLQGKRARPQLALTTNTQRQQVQLALSTYNPRGAQQGMPGIPAQAFEAVFTDAYNRQPGRHINSLNDIRRAGFSCRRTKQA
ncbi:hypothetical protein METHPM2_150026 [Pseudomonas sp. PM2]